MPKKNLLSSLFLLVLLTHTAFAGDTYSIKLKIKALRDSTCLLANYFGDKQYIQDTAKADKNGQFVFSGKKKLEPGMYMIVLSKKKLFDFIILENDQHFSLETDTLDFNTHMKVNGSSENKIFFEYLIWLGQKQREAEHYRSRVKALRETNKDSVKILQDKLSNMDKEVKKYMLDFMAKYPSSFTSKFLKATMDIEIPEIPTLPNGQKDSTFAYKYYKAHYFDNLDLADERLLRTPIYFPKIKQYLDNMVTPAPDSVSKEGDLIIEKARKNKETFKFCVFYMTVHYETSNMMGFDAVFVHEVFKYYKTNQAYWVDDKQKERIIKRANQLDSILIGKTAPNLLMQDSLYGVSPNFNNYSLNTLKAKYTILYFWDPACGHCQKETPKLVELYNKIKDKYGLKVYAVGVVSELEPWRKYIKEKNLNWINVIDGFNKNHYKDLYDVYSTPVIYILDENKKIIAKRLETDQVEGFFERYEKMMQLMKEKNKPAK